MSVERRVHGYIVAVTVAIMSLAVTLMPRARWEDARTWVEPLVAVLTGIGLREFLILLVEWRLRKSIRFKQRILGNSYVEGKWIGYYSEGDAKHLVIETIRQDWADLFINGRAFGDGGEPHGQWRSMMATVDGKAGLLHAIFSGDFMTGHYESVVTFQLEPGLPQRMYGLIVDSVASENAQRAWMRLQRVEGDVSDLGAIKKAREMLATDTHREETEMSEKMSPEERRIEGNKLLHETLKQLVTISSASIVILSALLEKLVATRSKVLMAFIGLSFICFLVSIVGSVFLMRNIGLNLAATESELKGKAYSAAKWFFLFAISLLVVYVIINLLLYR